MKTYIDILILICDKIVSHFVSCTIMWKYFQGAIPFEYYKWFCKQTILA